MNIDLTKVPVEPTVTIIDPEGNEVWTGNNPTTFEYIKAEIFENKLKDYKVRTTKGEFKIDEDGRILATSDTPVLDGLFPGDEYTEQLSRILGF